MIAVTRKRRPLHACYYGQRAISIIIMITRVVGGRREGGKGGEIRGGRTRTREEGKRRIPYIYIYIYRYHFNHRPSKSKIPMKILISFKMLSIIFETTYHYRVYTYPRCGREERRTEKGDQLEIIELLRLGYLSREMGRVNEAEVTRV